MMCSGLSKRLAPWICILLCNWWSTNETVLGFGFDFSAVDSWKRRHRVWVWGEMTAWRGVVEGGFKVTLTL